DQKALLEACSHYRLDYSCDLNVALELEWRPTPPTRFRTALIRQIGDPYYSLVAACAAVVEAKPAKLTVARNRLRGLLQSDEQLEEITNAWLAEMLSCSAFDPALGKDPRLDEFPYFKEVDATTGLKQFFDRIRSLAGFGDIETARLRETLFDLFTSGVPDSGRLVTNDSVVLRLALDEVWLQCVACGHLQ